MLQWGGAALLSEGAAGSGRRPGGQSINSIEIALKWFPADITIRVEIVNVQNNSFCDALTRYMREFDKVLDRYWTQ